MHHSSSSDCILLHTTGIGCTPTLATRDASTHRLVCVRRRGSRRICSVSRTDCGWSLCLPACLCLEICRYDTAVKELARKPPRAGNHQQLQLSRQNSPRYAGTQEKSWLGAHSLARFPPSRRLRASLAACSDDSAPPLLSPPRCCCICCSRYLGRGEGILRSS